MMTEEESIKWDNDPYAMKRTASTEYRIMAMLYRHLRSTNEPADSEVAKRASKEFPMSYAEWLKTDGKD